MASSAIHIPHTSRFTAWFSSFLRQELSPYPGRIGVVARMVLAATLSAILIVTFRIPGGSIGALIAFLLSRENLLSTTRSAFYLVLAFALGGLFVPIGARFFASMPEMHFLWEVISLFGIFFLLRTLSNFALASGLSVIATNALSIWYLPGPPNVNVELTLWQVAAAFIGAVTTLGVEIVFHSISRSNDILDGIHARLEQIEILLRSYGTGTPISPKNAQHLEQYAVIGMGTIRRNLARGNVSAAYRVKMSALASLVGRGIDFSAALSQTMPTLDPADRQQAALLSEKIAAIRGSLSVDVQPKPSDTPRMETTREPLLAELGLLVDLLPSVLSSDKTIDPRLNILEEKPNSDRIFVEDAFSNPDHIRFALAGTLAATLCYILYVGLDWPGISTSVTTCVLTALSNIGASRQKQVLRISGALIGGFVFGMGSQVFILPYIDSIAGFALLIASVTAIAAWVGTSSSRLSYAGLQMALAFYLINLNEFAIQTSLSVARDRVIGVLLGITMMWLVFEKLYSRPAVDEMVRVFVANLRQMSELVRISNSGVDAVTIIKIRMQRDAIYRNFGEVNAQADAVPFETGQRRSTHMAARDRIRRWQAAVRTFYLLETPLIQFRIFGDPHQRQRPFYHLQDEFRENCAGAFNLMAACLEDQLRGQPCDRAPYTNLGKVLSHSTSPNQAEFSERELALLDISKTLAVIVDRMHQEITEESLYSVALPGQSLRP